MAFHLMKVMPMTFMICHLSASFPSVSPSCTHSNYIILAHPWTRQGCSHLRTIALLVPLPEMLSPLIFAYSLLPHFLLQVFTQMSPSPFHLPQPSIYIAIHPTLVNGLNNGPSKDMSCTYSLIWKKDLCRCNRIKGLKMKSSWLDYLNGP